MSLLSVTDDYTAVANKLQIDVFDYTSHRIITVPSPLKPEENDHLADVAISSNGKYVATITSSSKQLFVYDIKTNATPVVYKLPRSGSKIRFTADNAEILVADKSGDVLIYDLNLDSNDATVERKLFGHLSLLLDVLQTDDERFIITTDRDEKIRVSCYPKTYNIQTYCLGHKEFVNHIDILPHNKKYLLSTSGDGTIKIWDYIQGTICSTIHTSADIDNYEELKNNFIKTMDEEGIEVDALPIVHFATTILNDNKSLVAVTVHSYNKVLIYSISNDLAHKLESKLDFEHEEFPTGIKFNQQTLFIYYANKSMLTIYYNAGVNNVSFERTKEEKVFKTDIDIKNEPGACLEAIKILYKRKFDNVQEYQERKKQRIEKSGIKIVE